MKSYSHTYIYIYNEYNYMLYDFYMQYSLKFCGQ